ncbi:MULTISPECIES: hypothetical protein [Bacteroidales]|uniref:Uncharacterized protein n=1 Tax=Parabacteroides distasonis TaxID=823 RepID=A0A6I2NQY1_PARDI|nr:hypothetical protein [Parabacteroides distasonis]MRY89443.1 hypothetical protein [Parabacteroides distasonis]MRY98000.1 hypothetical protein [Parabacteroides distasonis]MRZ02842.1 hypothetical protein [Parabacteroides distasonis]MRZ32346.1 hypothetical protein [Parabacteroides distasonis]MRZ37524.1 hypothetical protein [Parabacteroides distasonis]
MIFCIFGGGKCRPRWGVQRGLPLALLGNFQRYVVLRLGKFPNKLRYFLRKYPAACRPSARLPFGGGCPCRLLARNPTLFFPFRSVGGGAVVSVFKGSFARGGRIQGFPDKYARSEARGRFIGKRRSRLTF